ncbi:MAG: hypothetical protein ACTSX0_13370 [Promethearchaeota archaeon]
MIIRTYNWSIIMEHWYQIFSYFWWNDPVGIIASCIIIVLSVYLALYLAVELTEFAFWISIQSVKGACLAGIISVYSTVFVVLILPLNLISVERDLSESLVIYGRNIEYMVKLFFPRSEKDKKESQNRKAHGKKNVLPYEAPSISRKTRKVSQPQPGNVSRQARNIQKAQELNIKTEIHHFASSGPQSVMPKYFCSKCGRSFTPIMYSLLKRKNETFCEICGQKYVIQNGVPAPINN